MTAIRTDILIGRCKCGAHVAQRQTLHEQRYIGPCPTCDQPVPVTGTAELHNDKQ